MTARLIVRGIPDLTKSTDGADVSCSRWGYHEAFTESRLVLVQADGHHRGHQAIERAFAKLIDGRSAQLPSGPA